MAHLLATDTLGHLPDTFSDIGRHPDGHGHPLIRVSECPDLSAVKEKRG